MYPKSIGTKAAVSAILCLQISFLMGCGGSGGSVGGSSNPPPSATISGVSVAPASVNVIPGASQTFIASVSGSGAYSSEVNWSVNGAAGGSSDAGTISAKGVYTAPGTSPNPNTVIVTATSAGDNTKSGKSTVVIGNSAWSITGVELSPLNVTVSTRWTQQFFGTVIGSGTYIRALAWSVNGVPGGNSTVGTIDNTGFYSAPSSVPEQAISVAATSVEAPNISSSAEVTVVQDPTHPPIISQLSPSTANAGEQIQILGSGFNGGGSIAQNVWVNFTGANGTQIPTLLPFPASDTNLTVIVPLGAADGPVSVTAQASGGPTYSSNAARFTRAPRIRIRAPQQDLSTSETERFSWKQIAGSSPVTLTWAATAGSVTSDGTFTAPSVTSDTYVSVTACVQNTIYCDEELIGVHPLRTGPGAPIASPGQSVQLQAIQGNSAIGANWLLKGPGLLSSSGEYSASTQFGDAGGIPFVASANGYSADGLVEVTGQFPGLVNRLADYVAPTPAQDTYGLTVSDALVAANNKLYVDATYYNYLSPLTPSTSVPTSAQVVDVFDLGDPIHPIWVDAFEPLVAGYFSYCGGTLYQAAAVDTAGNERYRGGAIAAYNISGASPVPSAKILIPPVTFTSYQSFGIPGCTVAALTGQNGSQGTLESGLPGAVTIYSLQNGNIAESEYAFTVPDSPDGQGVWYLFSIGSDGKRLYIEMTDSTAAVYLATYDLTTSPPLLLDLQPNTSPVNAFQLAPIGDLLFTTNGIYSDIYDVSSNAPVLEGTLPGGYVGRSSGTTIFTRRGNGGLHTIDISNSKSPVLKATLFDYANSASDLATSGNYGYVAGGRTGVGIWDVGESGGPAATAITPNPAFPISFAGNEAVGFLVATAGDQGELWRYDLTQTPPVLVWNDRQGDSDPQSLALSGTTLYEGTTTELEIMDVSGPGAPITESSIQVPVAALAVSGNTLLVGTGDNRLLVYNITSPQNPLLMGSINLPAVPFQIQASGNLAMIADSSGGFLVYTFATPASPQLLSRVNLPEVYGVAVDGNLALLAAREYGLVVVDLSNPANPKVLAHSGVDQAERGGEMYNKAYSVAVLNKIAYVGVFNMDNVPVPDNGSSEIFGFDYSDPSRPRLVSLVGNDLPQDFSAVLWTSSKFLICGCTSFTYSFDLTQPRNIIAMFPYPTGLRPSQDPGSILPAFREAGGSALPWQRSVGPATNSHRSEWPKETGFHGKRAPNK